MQSTISNPRKKGVASERFTQLVDGQHWMALHDEQRDALNYIIAINEQAQGFKTFVGHISNRVGIYMTKTRDRNKAQRFSYSSAHLYACELSRYQNQETRVERVTSASREVA